MKSEDSPFKDERGAILVIAVFCAIFAVSMLYLAMGAGEAVLFREHIQDAADSAALSGAITHARIMNVLVLINMVMVAFLAILVTLKLIEGIAIVGMAIAAGLAWCTFGASLVAIPPLNALRTTMLSIYEEVKPLVFNALEILHDTSDEISKIAPYAAEGMAQGDIVGKDDGIDANGFGASTAETLPIEDDTFEGLCGKAGELSWHIANIPLSVIPGWGVIEGALSGPIGALTSSLSQWFCGDGNHSVPDLSQDLDLGYPKTAKATTCENTPVDADTYVEGKEKDVTNNACTAAKEEHSAAQPNVEGECQTQCELGGPFDRVTTQARAECDPTTYPGAKEYRYLVQDAIVDYKWNGAQWVRGEPTFKFVFANMKEGDGGAASLPCSSPERPRAYLEGPDTACGNLTWEGYFPGYNKTVHPDDDPTRVAPACTNECSPQAPPPDTEKDPTRSVAFRQVTHVFGCVRHERKQVDVRLSQTSPNSEAKEEGNTKSPKRVVKGTKLGDEQFQVRAFVVAEQHQGEAARLVRLGLWRGPGPQNPVERLRKLSGLAFAQAEYYFAGSPNAAGWMWTMQWRGRLKRFELPGDDDAKGALRKSCDRWASIDCAGMLGLAEDWKDLLLH